LSLYDRLGNAAFANKEKRNQSTEDTEDRSGGARAINDGDATASWLGAPVMVAAGSDDEHTTLPESESFTLPPRIPELWIVKGAHHQDLLAYNTEESTCRKVPDLQSSIDTAI
jgi:hypothetical protein